MTTVAEVDVKINAKLDSFLASSAKAQKVIADLDKRLNKLSNKTIKPTIQTKVGSTKDLALLERRLTRLKDTKLQPLITPKVGSTAELARLEQRLSKLGNKNVNVNVASHQRLQSSTSLETGALAGVGASFHAAAASLASAVTVKQIQEYADAWTEAGNKLRAASEIAGVQTRSLEELNNLAADTRTGLTETVDLYAKLIRAASGVAKSENEIAIATETINKAFKAGGATTQEQISGITQLGQALGSGILQGDELRSIRENAPIIAQAIANEFKTSIAGLKKLGEEGKLTSDRVFKAIVAAQKDVDAAFRKTNATISDSFTNLTNRLTEYIGHMDQSLGITKTVNEILGYMAGNIDSVANAAVAAGLALAAAFGGATLAGLLTNPFVLMAAAIGAAAFAVTELWDDIVPLQNSFATLGDYAQASWDMISNGVRDVSKFITDNFGDAINFILEAIPGTPQSFQKAFSAIESIVNGTVNTFMRFKDTIVIAMAAVPDAVKAAVIGAVNTMTSYVVTALNTIISSVNAAITAINSVSNYVGGTQIGLVDKIKEDFGQIPNEAAKSASDAAKAIADVWNRENVDYVGKIPGAVNQAINDVTANVTEKANEIAAARQELEREANRATALSNGGVSVPSTNYGKGVPASIGGNGKKKKLTDYQKEVEQIKEKTAALVAETQAQAAINPLVNDYGYAATRAKAAQELLTAAQKTGIVAGKELKDVQQLLNGEFDGLSPAAKEQAETMLKLADSYASAEAAAGRLKDEQEQVKQAMEDTKQLGKDVLGGFITDLRDGKSAAEAFSNALQKIADKLLDVGLDAVFGLGSFSNSGGIFSGLFKSFDGGGYTGTGGRSGGIDGKGGFAAILHPNETVIDHTKGITVPKAQLNPNVSGKAGPTSVTVDLNVQTDSSSIVEIADTRIKGATPTIVRAASNEANKITKRNMGGYIADTQARQM